MGQFLSYRTTAGTPTQGFLSCGDRRGEFRREQPHRTVLNHQELQLGHTQGFLSCEGMGEEVSLGGSYHIEQFLSYKNYSWDTHSSEIFVLTSTYIPLTISISVSPCSPVSPPPPQAGNPVNWRCGWTMGVGILVYILVNREMNAPRIRVNGPPLYTPPIWSLVSNATRNRTQESSHHSLLYA